MTNILLCLLSIEPVLRFTVHPNNLYENPTSEPDEIAREKMTFFNPFNANVIEGDSFETGKKSSDKDLGYTAILSSN